MAESRPTRNEWQKLYQAAIRIKELSPWAWMTEADVAAKEFLLQRFV